MSFVPPESLTIPFPRISLLLNSYFADSPSNRIILDFSPTFPAAIGDYAFEGMSSLLFSTFISRFLSASALPSLEETGAGDGVVVLDSLYFKLYSDFFLVASFFLLCPLSGEMLPLFPVIPA